MLIFLCLFRRWTFRRWTVTGGCQRCSVNGGGSLGGRSFGGRRNWAQLVDGCGLHFRRGFMTFPVADQSFHIASLRFSFECKEQENYQWMSASFPKNQGDALLSRTFGDVLLLLPAPWVPRNTMLSTVMPKETTGRFSKGSVELVSKETLERSPVTNT